MRLQQVQNARNPLPITFLKNASYGGGQSATVVPRKQITTCRYSSLYGVFLTRKGLDSTLQPFHTSPNSHSPRERAKHEEE